MRPVPKGTDPTRAGQWSARRIAPACGGRPLKSGLELGAMTTLFADLVREVTDLVRNEFALARAEFAEKADKVTGGVVLLALGALVSFAAIIAALRAFVFALAEILGEATARSEERRVGQEWGRP